MVKQIDLIQKDLDRAVMSLQNHFVFTGDHGEYNFPKESRTYDLLGTGEISETLFLLHKLQPELELVNLTSEVLTLKLKNI